MWWGSVSGGARSCYNARCVSDTSIGGGDVRFGDTAWTAVLKARDRDAPGAREALDRLVRAYWKPVYFFIRRRGARVEDAKDLTQGFFAMMLEREFLRTVDPGRGKFKTFLLTVLERYLANEHERAQAQKRGGGRKIVPLDEGAAETELRAAPGDSPENAFERAWGATVLARAFERMRAHRHWDVLSLHLEQGLGASEIAARLGRKPKDVENALGRGRKKLRDAVIAEILEYVATVEQAEEELAALLGRLARKK